MTKLITLEGACQSARVHTLGEAPKFAFSLFSMSGEVPDEIKKINLSELDNLEAGVLTLVAFSNQLKNENTLGKKKKKGFWDNLGRKTKNACLDFGPTVLTAAGTIAVATGFGAPLAPFLYAGAAGLKAADIINQKIQNGEKLTQADEEQKQALEEIGKTAKKEKQEEDFTKFLLPAGIGAALLFLL